MGNVVVALGALVTGLALIVAFSFLLSWPVYMLWNGCLVGAVSGVHEVTWLQAWGLNVLASCLFKNHYTSKKD